MKFDEMKADRDGAKERLREQMKKDWMEIVRDKLKDVAVLFGIRMTDDAKVRSRRFRK